MEHYLKCFHDQDIMAILNSKDHDEFRIKSLKLDLTILKANLESYYESIKIGRDCWQQQEKWMNALSSIQQQIANDLNTSRIISKYKVRENFPVQFCNLPDSKDQFPSFQQIWNFVQVKGTVYRTKGRIYQEIKREYVCRKCKRSRICEADRITHCTFEIPKKCSLSCAGVLVHKKYENPYDAPNGMFIPTQEIRIQEIDNMMSAEILTVELEADLVESCFIGDQVTICGRYETRSKKGMNEVKMVLRAMSVTKSDVKQKIERDIEELMFVAREDWNQKMEDLGDELAIRDEVIASFAPEIRGLYLIKLGIALILCSSRRSCITNNNVENPEPYVRDTSHILLVGDPGLGKSQLLKSAADISLNSVRSVGYGSTKAGLTAYVVKEDGEFQIEAGALVKANNGICCLDEFNLMENSSKDGIHEAMEQQRISIAKAGLVTTINTRCSILAGMNQKNIPAKLQGHQNSIGTDAAVLSRFDLIFELVDPESLEFDSEVANHILGFQSELNNDTTNCWSLEQLQNHIAVAREIEVKISDEAVKVLDRYFLFYHTSVDRVDGSRKTMRLRDSLRRLTKAHARLMLRHRAVIVDAVAVVRVMEATWSFNGQLLAPKVLPLNPMDCPLPLGPNLDDISTILTSLKLEELIGFKEKTVDDDDEVELEVKKPVKVNKIPSVTKPRHDSFDDLFDDIFEEINDEDKATHSSQTTTLPIRSAIPVGTQTLTPASTSTQISNSTPAYSEFTLESSTFNLEDEIKETEAKKIKLSKPVLPGIFNENAFKSLQSLSNFFNSSPVPEESPKPKHDPKTSVSKISTTTMEKLKRFRKISEDNSTIEERVEETLVNNLVPEEPNPSQRTLAQEFLDVIDDMDVWD
ncbi:unnamed protein product [Diamesa serratosioi]